MWSVTAAVTTMPVRDVFPHLAPDVPALSAGLLATRSQVVRQLTRLGQD